MSYQRWTEGDAYVIGTGDDDDAVFECVGCARCSTYGEIMTHLETQHESSAVALTRLREECLVVGARARWTALPQFKK